MKYKDDQREISGWGKASFSGLVRDLNYLKFQCLKVHRSSGERIILDASDVTDKFKKMDMKYTVERKPRPDRKGEMV